MSQAKAKKQVPNNHRLAFIHNFSPEYLESLEKQYQKDPNSLSADFALFFDALNIARQTPSKVSKTTEEASSQVAEELRVHDLIEAYRMRGHLTAEIDPLGLWQPPVKPHLDLSFFKLQNTPRDRVFQAAQELGLPPSPLSKIIEHLKNTYSRYIGVEYHHIGDEKIYSWLKGQIEKNQNTTSFSPEEKIRILKHLYRASIFESFLQSNYTGQKRFSLEGSESIIPALKRGIETCANKGAKEIVFGMAHRGRLNVLVNVMNKPYQEVFKEFEGAELPKMQEAMGDVKYHQGFSTDITTRSGLPLHLSLAPNPSHLESVDPVVAGVSRGKQETKYQGDKNAVVPFLIHGDASVIGQGVVPETLNLSQLRGYGIGGTIHIVINNQIGFTTLPENARSSLYCTDFGKAFETPVFHVNGDQVEDVIHAIELAAEYRMKFQRDVFVDIYCYRRYGHNEGDEPRFTQPRMYSRIETHPTVLKQYINKLTSDSSVAQEEVNRFSVDFKEELDQKRAEVVDSPRVLQADMFRGLWKGFELSSEPKMLASANTQIQETHFDKTIDAIHQIPDSIRPIAKFKRMIESRKKRILEKDEIDWAVGEQLAMGSLLLEGTPVRLSGQDSVRGTFSQRHLAVRDSTTGERYYFLNHLDSNQATLYCYDSPLSEFAVMGFDYGYSVAQPKTLVLWEAQFGDFANGAQVVIDQFIASAESKWYRMSGITLLLPHGYEGQGPEHSSARLERFLQLCAQNNMQVCYPTTPAQYAHLLRRQIHRNFRKPLIVITPKSMLRMPEVVSKKKEFVEAEFSNILIDPVDDKDQVKRVVLCSGKIYWELLKEAKAAKIEKNILFVRLEQLYPLNKEILKQLHDDFGEVPWYWVQEEPKNMGAWFFMRLKLLDLGINLHYVGRDSGASPATGSLLKHQREQRQLIKEGLGL